VTAGRRAALVVLVALATVTGAAAATNGPAAPELADGPWINGGPLTIEGLRGRVVFLEFWTYG
jgi:hypothetical protein